MFQHINKQMPWLILMGLLCACTNSAAAPQATSTIPAPTLTLAATARVIPSEIALSMQSVKKIDLPGSFITVVTFAPDGKSLLTAELSGEVTEYDLASWQKTTLVPAAEEISYPVTSKDTYYGSLTAFSPDGELIVTSNLGEGQVAGFDRAGRQLFTFSFGVHVHALAISPDSRLLAVGGEDNRVSIFDLSSRQPVIDLVSRDHEYLSNLVFSAEGSVLAASYERPNNVITLWDAASWQEKETFTHLTTREDYHDLVFTPDGRGLAVGTTNPVEIVFIDLATKEVYQQFPQRTRAPYQLAFSPDGSLFASACDDMTLDLWDPATGKSIEVLRTGGETGSVAFSPDGSLIAFSVWGQGFQVWSVTP